MEVLNWAEEDRVTSPKADAKETGRIREKVKTAMCHQSDKNEMSSNHCTQRIEKGTAGRIGGG
jgi:hypothetical protein